MLMCAHFFGIHAYRALCQSSRSHFTKWKCCVRSFELSWKFIYCVTIFNLRQGSSIQTNLARTDLIPFREIAFYKCYFFAQYAWISAFFATSSRLFGCKLANLLFAPSFKSTFDGLKRCNDTWEENYFEFYAWLRTLQNKNCGHFGTLSHQKRDEEKNRHE